MSVIMVTVTDQTGVGITNCTFSETDENGNSVPIDVQPFSLGFIPVGGWYFITIQDDVGALAVSTLVYGGTCYSSEQIFLNANTQIYNISLQYIECLFLINVVDTDGNPITDAKIVVAPTNPLFAGGGPSGYPAVPFAFPIVLAGQDNYTITALGPTGYGDGSTTTGFLDEVPDTPTILKIVLDRVDTVVTGTGSSFW
jgi:hypothetical protein